MKRATRQEIAEETVAITERGSYTLPNGLVVDITHRVKACREGTRLFAPADVKRLRNSQLTNRVGDVTTRCEVTNETTLAAARRLVHADPTTPVAALNFASAKNPGGGFLNGSQAQEESLARSSALYPSLLQAWDFYEQHRASASLLYSDAMILSPHCPVFRDDDGTLLAEPYDVAFITSPAPNAGAIERSQPEELADIPEVFARRSEYILALAAAHGYRRLILGAWGCGVFRNDPVVVAQAFAQHLHGLWAGQFTHIVFAVLDTSPAQATFHAFQQALTIE